jgi:hypothetical protein
VSEIPWTERIDDDESLPLPDCFTTLQVTIPGEADILQEF